MPGSAQQIFSSLKTLCERSEKALVAMEANDWPVALMWLKKRDIAYANFVAALNVLERAGFNIAEEGHFKVVGKNLELIDKKIRTNLAREKDKLQRELNLVQRQREHWQSYEGYQEKVNKVSIGI